MMYSTLYIYSYSYNRGEIILPNQSYNSINFGPLIRQRSFERPSLGGIGHLLDDNYSYFFRYIGSSSISFLPPVQFCICSRDSAVLNGYLFRQRPACVRVPNWKNVVGVYVYGVLVIGKMSCVVRYVHLEWQDHHILPLVRNNSYTSFCDRW